MDKFKQLESFVSVVTRDSLTAAAQAARLGATSTADMHLARAGRSASVPGENLQGVVDPGAEAVALVFEALAGL